MANIEVDEQYNQEFNVIEIQSLEDFTSKVSSMSESLNRELYFRGEKQAYSTTEPNIYRGQNKPFFSDKYYNQLELEAFNDLKEDKTRFDELTHLQHYGAKTRLLDVTSNPLVGLFFALDMSEKDLKDHKEAAYVYVFDSGNESRYLKSGDGDYAQIKSRANFISQDIVHSFIAQLNPCRNYFSPVNIYLKSDYANWELDSANGQSLEQNMPKDKKEKVFFDALKIVLEKYSDFFESANKEALNSESLKDLIIEINKIIVAQKYKHKITLIGGASLVPTIQVVCIAILTLLLQIKDKDNIHTNTEILSNFIEKTQDNIEFSELFQDLLNNAEKDHNQTKIDLSPITIHRVLTEAQIYNARKSTPRIIRQFGAFIMPAYELDNVDWSSVSHSIHSLMVRSDVNNEGEPKFHPAYINKAPYMYSYAGEVQHATDDELRRNIKPTIFKIDANHKKEIHDQLITLGFNVSSMYPDIEHISQGIIDKMNLM